MATTPSMQYGYTPPMYPGTGYNLGENRPYNFGPGNAMGPKVPGQITNMGPGVGGAPSVGGNPQQTQSLQMPQMPQMDPFANIGSGEPIPRGMPGGASLIPGQGFSEGGGPMQPQWGQQLQQFLSQLAPMLYGGSPKGASPSPFGGGGFQNSFQRPQMQRGSYGGK